MKENYIQDELLVKCLLGEATGEEQEAVRQWVADNKENERYYEHFRIIWEQSRQLAAQSTVDENAAWERFKQRTENAVQVKSNTRSLKPFYTWLKAAAVLLLLVGAGWMVYLWQGKNDLVVLQSGDNVRTDTLSDGSVVVLNKNASLSYPARFSGNRRDVTLKGEAFFTITPNKTKPFIIDANGVSVKVVGTSFNVKTAPEKTEVIVETGIVEVSKKKYTIQVKPHEKATVLKTQSEPVKQENTDELYNYYRTNELICNHTPLWRLVDILNEAYGVHIIIANEDLKNMQITTVFNNETLDHVLNVIGDTLGITVEKSGRQIILK